MNTFTRILKQQQIEDQINAINDWINQVGGHDVDKAIEFIHKHLCHLNENTKKSMYEHLLDKTQTALIDINKKNDLMRLINELAKLLLK